MVSQSQVREDEKKRKEELVSRKRTEEAPKQKEAVKPRKLQAEPKKPVLVQEGPEQKEKALTELATFLESGKGTTKVTFDDIVRGFMRRDQKPEQKELLTAYEEGRKLRKILDNADEDNPGSLKWGGSA